MINGKSNHSLVVVKDKLFVIGDEVDCYEIIKNHPGLMGQFDKRSK